MPRDPGSMWRPLPEAGTQGMYAKNKFIVHSTGSNGTAIGTWRYFANAGVYAESTFIVGQGPWDPTLQLLDSSELADANISANDEAISVEVVGDGYGGYNSWQRAEIIRLGIWAHKHHNIPLRIIPSPDQNAGGYGWHIMFGAPGPWTSVAKICPGAPRIAELKNDIFPAIWRGEEDDMPLTDADADKVVEAFLAKVLTLPDGTTARIDTLLTSIRQAEKSLQLDTDDIQTRLESFKPPVPPA